MPQEIVFTAVRIFTVRLGSFEFDLPGAGIVYPAWANCGNSPRQFVG
jgi:hypothetical protein